MLSKFQKYKTYITELLLFSLPIILGNVAHMLIGAGDVFIAAKHSSSTIEAISIATSISVSIYIIGIGFLASVSPVLSNYMGERKKTKKYFMASINYAMALAAVFCLLSMSSTMVVDKIGFESHLVPLIKEYIFIASFSFFGAYLHFSLKEFLQAYQIVMLPNIISIVAIFVNLLLNAILVFGLWGMPEFGISGLAIASVIVRTLMGITLFVFCFKFIKGGIHLDRTYFVQLAKVGYPIAIALLLEFMGFNIITILVGRISGIYAAAHSIVMTLASVTFMVPLAVSNAVAVKVGYANGAKDYPELRRYSIAGLWIAFVLMSIPAVLFFIIPEFFIKIFTSDVNLLHICVPLMFAAALFQVFDGLQVTLGGILKGLKMTQIVSIAVFAGYWIVGIPLGSILAFKFNMNLLGYWIGLASALFCISAVMMVILHKKLNILKKAYIN